jgi:hypothetical protein
VVVVSAVATEVGLAGSVSVSLGVVAGSSGGALAVAGARAGSAVCVGRLALCSGVATSVCSPALAKAPPACA